MNKIKEFLIYILITILMAIIYINCSKAAENGYGYSGYRGFQHHHSFWYIRRYNENYYPSNRENSISGNNFSKRGLSGGK